MSQTEPIISDAQLGLYHLANELTDDHDLETGVAAIVLFETMADLLRARAPMEFDEYLSALGEEMPKGALIDQDRLDELRNTLVDILIMNTRV